MRNLQILSFVKINLWVMKDQFYFADLNLIVITKLIFLLRREWFTVYKSSVFGI